MTTNLGLVRAHDNVPNHIAYGAVVENVTRLLTDRPVPEGLPVSACPGWTVRDLVGHVVGTCALAVGRCATWAGATRLCAGLDLAELLGEWAELAARAERLLVGAGGRGGNLMVMDAHTHELDLRYALGRSLPADHPAFDRALAVLLAGFSGQVVAHRLPALLVDVDGRPHKVGDGEVLATLTGDRFDIYRSLAGRRTYEQITRLGWSCASHRWLPAFAWGPFQPPDVPVESLRGYQDRGLENLESIG